ncbi:serine/threonine protein phosphatase [Streptomyces sp. 4N509B]|uniref:serine/threonine protein phosphatase n=1 Tax=Streptomyces sp. 4N509B TaxID=3457413 RepID=UPI003FD3C7D7
MVVEAWERSGEDAGDTGDAGGSERREPAASGGGTAAEAGAGTAGHATWAGGGAGVAALTVWTERRAGRGEDAEPLAVYHRVSGHGLLAVFDGSGGSGAAPAWQGRTGAWAGARVARLAAECWFQRAVTAPDGWSADGGSADGTSADGRSVAGRSADGRATAPHAGGGESGDGEGLAYALRRMLGAVPAPTSRSRLTGTMRRRLPTTVAALRYRFRPGEDRVRWQALWAGDSRAYALLPGSGLHALTRDDTVEEDALEQLRQDPPMTNVVCADRPFTVHATPPGAALRPPCVLLAATDGFFGYVTTPARFEWLLLRTLAEATGLGDWAGRLRDAVQPETADDASLSLVALGFDEHGDDAGGVGERGSDRDAGGDGDGDDTGDGGRPERGFVALRAAFAERHERLTRAYGDGPPAPPDGDAADWRRWQDETWRTYRTDYERFMAEPTTERPEGGR